MRDDIKDNILLGEEVYESATWRGIPSYVGSAITKVRQRRIIIISSTICMLYTIHYLIFKRCWMARQIWIFEPTRISHDHDYFKIIVPFLFHLTETQIKDMATREFFLNSIILCYIANAMVMDVLAVII